jgi:hypothetical protein
MQRVECNAESRAWEVPTARPLPEIHKAAAVGASIILACKMPHYLNFVQSVDCQKLVLDSQLSPRSSTQSKTLCYHRRVVLAGKNG